MTVREKVIRGLEHCGQPMECDGCPYDTEVGNCFTNLKTDALELLKEQEPVKPYEGVILWDHTYGRCGHCLAPLPALEGLRSKFCWMCGRPVKWDDRKG